MSAQEQLKELLRNTGREVAKEVGTHLKDVARDRAVAYAQDLIGEGLADEMGLAAKSVGGTAFSSALSQMGDVTDAASARRVAVCTWIIHTILTYLKMLMAVRV